jgi:hypothetical protein
VTSLVQSGGPGDDDLDRLLVRVSELEVLLGEREAESARVKSDLDSFRITYRRDVGMLHEELDKLELAIAEAELGELSRQADRGTGDPTQSPAGPRPEMPPRYTTDAVRKLFRDVAKIIHPDLSRDHP